MSRKLALFVLSICFGAITHAQDAQYWNFQFGAKSALLGGAVIGSVDDISAVFYNPGALALIEDPAFTVSANVFEYSTVRLADQDGRGVDIGTNSSGIRPSLIAGTLGQDVLGEGGVLSYSALTRQSGSFDLQGIYTTDDPEVFPALDYEEISSLSRYDGTYNDLWVGLTYAKPIGEHIGAGISWYNALRSQRQYRDSELTLIHSRDDVTSSSDSRGGNFFTARILFKAGLSFRWEKLTLGLNVTTPGIHLFGNGNIGVSESYFSSDSTYLATNSQNKVKATYKSPVSVGFGLGYRINRFQLHASGEWYGAVDSYDVMRGEDWTIQQPPGTLRESVSIHQQGSIFNWGIGLQYDFKNQTSLYGSFFVDNSVREDIDARADLTISPVDINNISFGTDFRLKRTRIDLGLGMAWGSVADENLNDLIQGAEGNVEVRYVYRSFRLLFGIEVGSKD